MPVECVIADSCIGGFAEAAACAEKFSHEGVGVSLTVTPCWCYGSETMDLDPLIPKAIWGFNGSDRPGAVYLAAFTSLAVQVDGLIGSRGILPAAEFLADNWDVLGPMLHGVMATGEATWSVDQPLWLNRHGFAEEAFFTYSYSPILDGGSVGGVGGSRGRYRAGRTYARHAERVVDHSGRPPLSSLRLAG